MDIILLGITIVALGVALVMSLAAWRLMRDDKKRTAARVAALSVAAASPEPLTAFAREAELTPLPKAGAESAVVRSRGFFPRRLRKPQRRVFRRRNCR